MKIIAWIDDTEIEVPDGLLVGKEEVERDVIVDAFARVQLRGHVNWYEVE